MPQSDHSSNIAARTLAEIIEIDRRIASLVEFRDGLKRVLSQVNSETNFDTAINHARASHPTMIEYLVVQSLRDSSGGSLKTKELFQNVCTVTAQLKYVTFRSHLHRLKQRGIISPEGRGCASWRLGALPK